MGEKPAYQVDWLIEQLKANKSYFSIALQALEILGWIEKTQEGFYRLTDTADPDFFSMSLSEVYQVVPAVLLKKQNFKELLLQKLKRLTLLLAQEHSLSVQLAEGAIVLPLLQGLKQLEIPESFEGFQKLPQSLRQAIEAYLVQKQWLHKRSKTDSSYQLTEIGTEVFNKVGVLLIPASYRPMLAQMDELLFGDATAVFARQKEGHEGHVDRSLNVIASGFQHGRYFKDAEALILKVFDTEPLSQQPKAIADVGCGDGSFLKHLYKAIQDKTRRGKALKEFELTLIGIDFNASALEETQKNLKNLPFQTLQGDINDPAGILKAMEELGFSEGKQVLHVRSFLDHNFSCDANQAPDESLQVLADSEDGIYVDVEGRPMNALQVLSAWREHLKRWTEAIDQGDLFILEAHRLPTVIAKNQLKIAESFYFDTIHAFSHQYLISAESFLVLAASVGLFGKASSKRYPKQKPFCNISLNYFERRDYTVRYAKQRDLVRLYELEQLCWKPKLKMTKTRLAGRLQEYPEGQFALEREGKVVGVIYSQRIHKSQELYDQTASKVHQLHKPKGKIVQLLAINIDPSVQNLGLGDQLLEFMLQRCSVMNGVESVVGVTLCKNYDRDGVVSFADYIQQSDDQGRVQDPVLYFHQSHGARIVEKVEGYRPEDQANLGNGVLIEYDIYQRQPFSKTAQTLRLPTTAKAKSSIAQVQKRPPFSAAEIGHFVQEMMERSLGKEKGRFAMDRPIMEMGLDSADLLELQERICQRYSIALEPAFFFKYSTPQKVVNYLVQTFGVKKPGFFVKSLLFYFASALVLGGARAVDKRNSQQATPAKEQLDTDQVIAIVGVSCRLPGGIEDLDGLATLLKQEKIAIGALPADRWRWPSDIDPNGQHKGIDKGGFLDDIARFDPSFFRISPHEAELMDPQQRMLLELSWECLEDAGIPPVSLWESKTGVFIGASGSDYAKVLEANVEKIEAHFGLGTSLAVLPNRLSYFYNWSGPSQLIDTACSSSLVALHQAVQSIRLGESDQALVGGIHLMAHPSNTLAYYEAGMLAQDGLCKTFDASANGYVRGEGAVVLLLKPLAKAEIAGDRIYGIIRGSAINHGGESGGLTVPNPQKQAELLVQAYENAGVDVASVSYLEAHGTGTSLGDPVEVEGIKRAFNNLNKGKALLKESCGLGSIKTNIGHLEAAAGLAGLLKVLTNIRKQILLPSLSFKKLNSKINFSGSPLFVVDKQQTWKSLQDIPLRAGVSSFGSGGANAHVVVEQYSSAEKTEEQSKLFGSKSAWIPLSAKSQVRLEAYAQKLLDFIRARTATNSSDGFATSFRLNDLAYTLQVGREAMSHRLILAAKNFAELEQKLTAFLSHASASSIIGCYWGQVKKEKEDLQADEGMQGLVAQWIEKEKISFVAKLWIEGVEVDWNLLYQGKKPRRISAPTYPFTKERYWISEPAEAKTLAINSGAAVQQLHPLVHENTSDFAVQQFHSSFTGNEFFLADHKVQDQRVLPGVAYLEMARVAGQLASKQGVISLKNVVWAQPIVVESEVNQPSEASKDNEGREASSKHLSQDKAGVEVDICLYPEGDSIAFEVITGE